MKTFKQFTEDKEYQDFCNSINEDFASNVLDKVGSVSTLFKRGWKSIFKSKNKVAKNPQELSRILKKNQDLIDSVNEKFDDGGETVDMGKVIETIVDKTQNIPVLSIQQKQMKKNVESMKNDTKLKKALKIVFTDKYIKNKSLEDRLAYAWIVLAGQITFAHRKLDVKAGIPIKS